MLSHRKVLGPKFSTWWPDLNSPRHICSTGINSKESDGDKAVRPFMDPSLRIVPWMSFFSTFNLTLQRSANPGHHSTNADRGMDDESYYLFMVPQYTLGYVPHTLVPSTFQASLRIPFHRIIQKKNCVSPHHPTLT